MTLLNEIQQTINRLTIGCWVSGVCTLVFIFMGIIGSVILPKLIQGQINDSIALQQETIDVWGQNPGQIGVITSRKFVFFQFANPWGVSFYNETPIFIEQDPVYYQEHYNFTNPTWVERQNIVNYDYWLFFTPMNNTTGDQIMNTFNVGPLGAWWTVQNSPDSGIALNVLSGLLYGFKEALLPTVFGAFIAENLHLNNLPAEQEDAKTVIYGLLGQNNIFGEHADFIYQDQLYGLHSNLTIDIWTQAAINGMDHGASVILKNYFQLDDDKFQGLLEYMQVNVQAANKSLVQNYYCHRFYQAENCTGLMLGIVQWVEQGITMNPPLEGEKVESIVSPANLTTQGYPEISFFLQQYFKEHISDDPQYQKIKFTQEQGARWGQMSDEENDWVKTPYALLHQGNLEFLFDRGDDYDRTYNTDYLVDIKNRFILTDIDQAFVFWKYVQYLVFEFAQQRSQNGSSGSAALGAIVAEGLYDSFTQLQDYLLPKITAELIFQNLTSNSTSSCRKIIDNSITEEPVSNDNITAICSQPQFVNWNYRTVEAFVDLCDYRESERAVEFRQYMNRLQFSELCERKTKINNFGSVLAYYNYEIQNFYNCSQFGDRCSEFQIALKQWSTSSVTKNVPSELQNVVPVSETIRDWAPKLFHTPIEIGVILRNLSDTFKTPVQNLSESEALSLLNFDRLFSGTLVSAAFLLQKNATESANSKFAEIWVFKEPQQLISYFRYIALYYTFGGFSQQRRAKDLLFGYKDHFIESVINQNPQQGGDPCANTLVAFNDLNGTLESAQILGKQSMYTGINDPTQVRQFRDYYSHETEYISFNQTQFDGNQCHWSLESPWKEKVKLHGSDGSAFPPIKDESAKQYAYLSNVFQVGQLQFSGQRVQRSGFETLRYTLSKCNLGSIKNCPGNSIYYSEFEGVMNLTSALGLPLFNSKGHFKDAQDAVQNSNIIYKKENDTFYKMTPSIYDESYLNIQPNTGAPFNVVLVLQVSFLFEGGDDLFPYPFKSFMPIFYVYRSANLTDDQINDNLGQLVVAFKIRQILTILGFTMGGLLFVLTIFLFIIRRRLDEKRKLVLSSSADNQVTMSLIDADGFNNNAENNQEKEN